jgi:hypothetical protein
LAKYADIDVRSHCGFRHDDCSNDWRHAARSAAASGHANGSRNIAEKDGSMSRTSRQSSLSMRHLKCRHLSRERRPLLDPPSRPSLPLRESWGVRRDPVCEWPSLRGFSLAFPSPALGERCHRSLARRLEPWCASAPERQYLALLRNLLANDYAATYLDASFVDAISARR